MAGTHQDGVEEPCFGMPSLSHQSLNSPCQVTELGRNWSCFSSPPLALLKKLRTKVLIFFDCLEKLVETPSIVFKENNVRIFLEWEEYGGRLSGVFSVYVDDIELIEGKSLCGFIQS